MKAWVRENLSSCFCCCCCCFYLFIILMFVRPFIGIKVSYLGSVQPWLVILIITRWQFTDSGACLLASDWSLRWLAQLTSRAWPALWFSHNAHLRTRREKTTASRIESWRQRVGETSALQLQQSCAPFRILFKFQCKTPM